MFDRLAPDAHQFRVGVEPLLDILDQMLMNPTRDPAFLRGRALSLDRAGEAGGRRPIVAQLHAVFDVAIVVGQDRAGWAAIGVLLGQIGEVLFAEAAVGLRA